MRFLFCVIAMLLLVTIALAFLGCGENGVEAGIAPQTEVVSDYPCPPLDRGNWTLLTTLPRNNFSPETFRIPKEMWDPINQAYVDQKDFFFIIYRPSQPLNKPIQGNDRIGGSEQHRYYLENPGLLHNNALTMLNQNFHFIDPNADWFRHWNPIGPEAGFSINFDATTDLSIGEFLYAPEIGASGNASFGPTGGGAPQIVEGFVLDIYT